MSDNRRCKKKEAEVPPGAPLWIVTYSDMISLLCTFFILLITFSSMDTKKFKMAKDSIQGALGLPYLERPENVTDIPNPHHEDYFNKPPKMHKEVFDLEEISESKGIRLKPDFYFYPGEARLPYEAPPILNQIAKILASSGHPVVIEGYTDERFISDERYSNPWELSFERALVVWRYLAERGITKERMSIAACGAASLAKNEDPVIAREHSRRVEIVVWEKRK